MDFYHVGCRYQVIGLKAFGYPRKKGGELGFKGGLEVHIASCELPWYMRMASTQASIHSPRLAIHIAGLVATQEPIHARQQQSMHRSQR